MIAQIGNTLFVTPNKACELCDQTGLVYTDRSHNATDDCPCITWQINEHEFAFYPYEVIGLKHKLYGALRQLEMYHIEIEQREHNRVVSFLYKTTK